MSVYPLILQVPDHLYEQLRQQATAADHSIEEEALTVLATATPDSSEIHAINETLSTLHFLNDDALWATAQDHLSQEVSIQLEQLNHKQQREGLTESEVETLERLSQQYEQMMLLRAQAAVLLKERGHDISGLVNRR